MMPGAHMPPGMPGVHPVRRQSDFHYMPQQSHSPVQHMPYGYHPQYPQPPPYGQPWYPTYQHQYTMPPRPFQQHQHQHPHPHPHQHQHHAPLVVSSPHQPQPMQNMRPVHTPPIPPPSQTPQPAPSTPSVHSVHSQAIASPTTPVNANIATPPPRSASRPASFAGPKPPQGGHHVPFYPQLPWMSHPDEPFPPPATRRRRRRRDVPDSMEPITLPSRDDTTETTTPETQEQSIESSRPEPSASDMDTPRTSQAPSEIDSTHPTTPSSSVTQAPSTRTQPTHARTTTRPAVPLIPITPAKPRPAASEKRDTNEPQGSEKGTEPKAPEGGEDPATPPASEAAAPAVQSPPKAAPKSWADLVRRQAGSSAAPAATASAGPTINGAANTQANSVADVLDSYRVDSDNKIAFLEPRGLVNTGNMCYMNSILQVLVFCIPFYDFLDQVGKRAAHSFKSETPLVDAMIMFMREFNIIDSAVSAEQLRLRLKDQELEQYGDAFIPEYVYDVIKRLPRFSTMRRGHQQDAEEFLGFLLEGLHDECVQTLKSKPITSSASESRPTTASSQDESGWLEVGPKQKAAVTRSSGFAPADSPVTKIFGGQLRSELRIPGLKNSVTLEPYQPLQLDIGSPQVANITDALKNLTRPETLQGDFNSARGPGISATKQVFIETLPPVLILHLKRFQYDNTGGTQKIWKRVGYPLELELPREVFPPARRAGLFNNAGGRGPRYRLSSVVYHHGKNASGGHYTVDVRRQDGREWIRLDDTVIRRVRSAEVAEGGAEEDSKALREALEQHKRDDKGPRKNLFEEVGEDDGESDGGAWSQANGASTAQNRKWAGVVNGTSSPAAGEGKRTPRASGKVGDKVAYILFYEQIKG